MIVATDCIGVRQGVTKCYIGEGQSVAKCGSAMNVATDCNGVKESVTKFDKFVASDYIQV